MSTASAAERRARVGSLALATTLLLPVVLSVGVSATMREHPATDVDVGVGMAWALFGTRAAAAGCGLLAVFLLTSVGSSSGRDARNALRATAAFRAVGECVALALLSVPDLVIWQSALAVAIVDVAFTASLLRFLAALFADRGKADLARSTLRYRWLYGFTRLSLLTAWFLPPEDAHALSPYTRALGPVLVGVLVALLGYTATLLRRPVARPPLGT